MMKEKFMEPELEVIHFSVEDVITVSSVLDDDELPGIIIPQ